MEKAKAVRSLYDDDTMNPYDSAGTGPEFRQSPLQPVPVPGPQELHDAMRTLWEQHVFWTRLVILGIVSDLPDLTASTERLLRNPADFGGILRIYYGEPATSQFVRLFTDHLQIAAQLVKAAKAGDTRAAEAAERSWYQNADQIARFLGSINPYWSEQQWRAMLHEHLALTKAEAVALLTRKYPESVRLFDEIERQALMMADMMTQGIIRQFYHRPGQ
ncbi:hypothetical protein [Sporolactobacillus vineae]|uniref:hypothetical protein n=1 Tax=Sporolactobacillus vineae TaxID=444463 RepID=UPI00028825AB|nr:hypothetical protein [Sporolactobacillus vineae]